MIPALGLDLSLAATGVARADGHLATIVTHTDDTGRRLHEIAVRLDTHLPVGPPGVVMVEAVAGGHPRTNIKLAQLHGIVHLRLFELKLAPRVVEVVSSSLKKYATGGGRASKEEMVETAANRALALGVPGPRNDNEADAFWLRQIAWDNTAAYRAQLEGSPDDRDRYRIELLGRLFGRSAP